MPPTLAGASSNFYPRSPCGERPAHVGRRKLRKIHFYPRSPCGERLALLCASCTHFLFLSTLSLRRATFLQFVDDASPTSYFYPRSPCGERRLKFLTFRAMTPTFLSTLSLRRATGRQHEKLTVSLYFYPRSPCGERREAAVLAGNGEYISIHALLAESDKAELR